MCGCSSDPRLDGLVSVRARHARLWPRGSGGLRERALRGGNEPFCPAVKGGIAVALWQIVCAGLAVLVILFVLIALVDPEAVPKRLLRFRRAVPHRPT